jgi:hypothetical protein
MQSLRRNSAYVLATLCIGACVEVHADDKVSVALVFKPGYTHTIKLVEQSLTEFTDGELAMEDTIDFDVRVEKVSADGNASVVATINEIGKRIDARWFDASSDEVQGLIKSAADALKGKKFEFDLSPEGGISNAKGLEALRKVIDDSFAATKAKNTSEDIESAIMFLEIWLKPPMLQYQIADVFFGHQKDPVALGESWTIKDTANMYLKSDIKRTFTFESIAAKQLNLTVSGGGTGEMEHDIKSKQKVEGTIKLNRTTNWPESTDLTYEMDQTYMTDGKPSQSKTMIKMTVTGSEK